MTVNRCSETPTNIYEVRSISQKHYEALLYQIRSTGYHFLFVWAGPSGESIIILNLQWTLVVIFFKRTGVPSLFITCHYYTRTAAVNTTHNTSIILYFECVTAVRVSHTITESRHACCWFLHTINMHLIVSHMYVYMVGLAHVCHHTPPNIHRQSDSSPSTLIGQRHVCCSGTAVCLPSPLLVQDNDTLMDT